MKRYPNGADGQVLLHEARALPPPGLDLALLDRALVRERHRLPDHPGPPRAPLGREPRMHRPEPVVRAVRRRRPARLPALRPRPGSGRDVREGARERAARARGARGARDARYAKTTGSRGIHVYVPIVRGPTQKQVWTFAKELARALDARSRPSSPRSTRSRSGRRDGSSWTTTRTRGGGRSPRSTRCGRGRRRRSRRR